MAPVDRSNVTALGNEVNVAQRLSLLRGLCVRDGVSFDQLQTLEVAKDRDRLAMPGAVVGCLADLCGFLADFVRRSPASLEQLQGVSRQSAEDMRFPGFAVENCAIRVDEGPTENGRVDADPAIHKRSRV